ncbi:PREDICTED: uncharacterized protein LOC103071938 [Lipotes vexillifer]|uniref:Uncharacterized protein LOC103071938 n=1 Tax=Lipotes vexillifer TaxID=118797 RepID=A0A340X426_LIPVE|nr:PREDICTED: uncharacterized protein LOC103071938 [Lipotes vexillifer]
MEEIVGKQNESPPTIPKACLRPKKVTGSGAHLDGAGDRPSTAGSGASSPGEHPLRGDPGGHRGPAPARERAADTHPLGITVLHHNARDSRRHRLLARAGPDWLRGRTAHAPEPPRSSATRSKRQASLWSGRRERCGAVGDLSEYAVNGASCLRCPDVAKVQSIQMSEDTDNIAVEENVDKHLQKDLNVEENQNIIETVRGKVREKLKNAKINQGKKSSTQLLIDNKIYQRSKTEVSLDEGLSFFILSGKEDSTLGQSAEQRSVNASYHKHFSLGDNLQNFAEGRDEDFMEEVIFLDLLEVKAADYEDDQEQVKKQQANIFVPSNSPGKVFTRKYSSH